MNTFRAPPSDSMRNSRRWTMLAACLLTFAAANSQAVDFPNVPLESGAQYPPPNVRFILDDSGSMNQVAMPANLEDRDDYDTSGNGASREIDYSRISDASYVTNTIYYNPAKTYRAWMQADGTRMANASFTSASRSMALLDVPYNLSNDTQTFYVPKTASVTGTNAADYYRYQIIESDAATAAVRGRIVRSEWLTATAAVADTTRTVSPDPLDVSNLGATRNRWVNGDTTETAPDNITAGQVAYITLPLASTLVDDEYISNLVFWTSDGDEEPLLYVREGQKPTTTLYDCVARDNFGDKERCSFAATDLQPGARWYFGLRANDAANNNAFTGVRLRARITITNPGTAADPRTGVAGANCATSGTSAAWRDCQYLLPDDGNPDGNRDEAGEKANYANWYQYHRTRMKVAKAGASEAFSLIGDNLRIGFDSINRNNTGVPFNIQVGTDDGLFRDTNKSSWYSALHSVTGENSTLLHRALQRAGDYFSDTTSANNPWKSSSARDLISCRQNFAILTTDGYWNSTSGYTAVGDADGTEGPTVTGPGGADFTYEVGNPYQDDPALDASHRTDTLADVAMHYWKNDLTTALPNNVSTSSDDPAFWQHMVTFGVSIGLKGTLDPDTDLPGIEAGTTRWTDARPDAPGTTGAYRIDDLWHASVNGRGSFIVAANSDEFAQGLLNAFELVASREGSASNVTANSTSFTDDTKVFQASYRSGAWWGELLAFQATSAGVADDESWKGSEGLTGTREFYTWDPSAGTDGDGATFPTTAQTTALDASTRTTGPVSGADNVAYIKGERSLELPDGDLRSRSWVLGDIVNSSPFYTRDTDTIYVGSNDGMLHAFDADSGDELFAYVPGGIDLTALSGLSNPRYEHAYFVDGPIVVSSLLQTPDHNYLVGALGRGGKGLFALDVTAPDSFDETDVLWELTDDDLGNVLGEPLIATLNDGDETKVIIVGNGLNSDNGNAVLLVVDIATGEILDRLDTGKGGDNGLFAPRGWDNDGNGTVDFVYSADRLGNVWKFDFSGTTPVIGLGGDPLFTTPDIDPPAGTDQPFTTGLALARDPKTSKRWVFVGTGSYLTTADPDDDRVQSLYALIDEDEEITATELHERSITATGTISGRRVRVIADVPALDTDEKGWFMDLDNPTAGERVVTRPQIRGTLLIFTSRIPPVDNTCDAGGSGYLTAIPAFPEGSIGSSYIDSDGDGSITDEDDNLGYVDPDNPGSVVGSVDLGIGMPTLPTIIDELAVVGGSGGDLGSIKINPQGGVARRASWQEILGD
jgi:type IV pilus assembly protein PilY1